MALLDILEEIASNLQRQGPSIADLIAIREQRRREKQEQEEKKLAEEPVTFAAETAQVPALPEDIASLVGQSAARAGVPADLSALEASARRQKLGLGTMAKQILPGETVPRFLAEKTLARREKQFERATDPKTALTNAILSGKIDPSVFSPEQRKLIGIDDKVSEGFTLGPEYVRYDAEGNIIAKGPSKTKEGDKEKDSDYRAWLSMAQRTAIGQLKFNDPNQLAMITAMLSNPAQAETLTTNLERSMTPEQRQAYDKAISAFMRREAPDWVVDEFKRRRSRTGAADTGGKETVFVTSPNELIGGQAPPGGIPPIAPETPIPAGTAQPQGKVEQTKILNGKRYVKINGQWYEQ